MEIRPYQHSGKDKKQQIEQMFDHIAGHYDFLNHLLSFNVDHLWRKKAIKILKSYHPKNILDIGTGTGDFAIAATKTGAAEIIGFDLSEKMIQSGIKKVKHLNLEKTIRFQKGDSEDMPFNENSFDSAIAAFSVRNFAHLKKGLEETFRVLKPNGVFIILEFSKPKYFPFRQIYNFYFLHVLPIIGSFFTKDKHAYSYLPKSVMNFPDAQNFIQIYSEAGFTNIKQKRLTGGIASIYIGEKKTL